MKRVFIISLILVSLLFVPKEEVKNVQVASSNISSRSLEKPRQEHIVADNKMVTDEEIVLEQVRMKNKATNISQEGINLIKKYEGLKLHSYRLQGEQYYTIGYGHYGKDVQANQTITEEQAEELLIADLQGTVNHILNNYQYLELNQNELDALVSFTYNCGIGSLNRLTANKTRSKEEIAEHITAYTKSESEVNRNGLQKRRNEEKALFEGLK